MKTETFQGRAAVLRESGGGNRRHAQALADFEQAAGVVDGWAYCGEIKTKAAADIAVGDLACVEGESRRECLLALRDARDPTRASKANILSELETGQ